MINTCFPHDVCTMKTAPHSHKTIYSGAFARMSVSTICGGRFTKHYLTKNYYYYYYYHYVCTTNMHSVDYYIHKQSGEYNTYING